jgi:hypothetical protein
METRRVGIILNGVTGRMGANQHLERSIMALRQQGGVRVAGATIMPDPILVGRSADKLRVLSERHGGIPFSTDLRYISTPRRRRCVSRPSAGLSRRENTSIAKSPWRRLPPRRWTSFAARKKPV